MHVVGRTLWHLLRLTLIIVVGIATLVGVMVGTKPVAHEISRGATSVAPPVHLPPQGGISYVYDRYGNLQQSFNRKIQSVVPISDVSTPAIESVLAVEDSDFYRHSGVDARSILRALQANVSNGGVRQGGSTITQQVVKKALVGDKRDLKRKLHEARVATTLEHQLTKNEILSYYLNMVYLGNNIYGVQAAAQTYWGTDASKLDWAQGALIAALIRNPNGYDPIHHPDSARSQRRLALDRLVASGRLAKAEAKKANREPLPKTLTRTVPPRDYFVEEVRARLLNKDGAYDNDPLGTAIGKTPKARADALYGGGLRIYTTYDPLLQQKAIAARQSTVPGIQPDGRIPRTAPDGSTRYATETVTSVEPSTGAVRVLLGGPGFTKESQVDIATGHSTNPGSTFKAFVLAALFDRGFVPSDIVNGTSSCLLVPDDPNYVGPTRPTPGVAPFAYHNYEGEGGSVGTIETQTLQSSNCGFARLAQIVGLRHVVSKAKAMGLENRVWNAPDPRGEHRDALNPYSVQLAYGGTIGVSSLEMAGAYATFANDGVFNTPYLVDRIEDSSGHVIWTHKLHPERVVSMQTARLINQVLEDNIKSGTGTGARLAGGRPGAGKTGTSDGPYDLWFAGYTPQLSTTVWIGSTTDPFVVYSGGAGGGYAAPSWRAFMNAALENQPKLPFAPPEPTRTGIRIAIGPEDGMTFAQRYDEKVAKRKPAPPDDHKPDSRSGSGSPKSTIPSTTVAAPPDTAYIP